MTPLLSTRLLTDKKNGSSYIFKPFSFFMREQQRSGFRFWRWRMTKAGKERESQMLKDTMKPSAPSRATLEAVVETNTGTERHGVMNAPRILREMTHFFHLRTKNDCSKSNAQCSAQLWVIFFCSSCNCAENHMAHKSCGHSLFPPRLHGCHMLSRGGPFVFQGALGKALMPSKRRMKKEKRTGTFHRSCPPSEVKTNVY